MRHRLLMMAFGIAVVLLLVHAPVMAAEAAHLGGTGGAMALLDLLGRSFTQRSGIAIKVLPGLHSSGGTKAAVGGVPGVNVAGRPLPAAEQAPGLVAASTVRTPLALATAHFRPPTMASGEIIQAYASEKAVWLDGSRIKRVLRPRPDSDSHALAIGVPGIIEFLQSEPGRRMLREAGCLPSAE